jgi:hypothetical protein
MREKKIVWLASYPKSGNTWFRIFLTALLQEGALNINQLKTDGIFSSREIFDGFTDLDSTLLTDEETRELHPHVYRAVADQYEKDHLFIKMHDAYTFNCDGDPVVPEDRTACALYFIRNPLDIVASFAVHMNTSLDKTISFLNAEDARLSPQKDNHNVATQLPQTLMSWSMHVKSWMELPGFPVKFIRYEDMVKNTLATFSAIMDFIGIDATQGAIQKALDASSFEKIKRQETERGFRETLFDHVSFFRKGTINNWEAELTPSQSNAIKDVHREVMLLFNYL